MKQMPNIATTLYCEPWAVMPEVHATLSAQFRRYLREGPRQSADEPVGPSWVDWNGKRRYLHPQVEKAGPLALVPVKGVLGKHLSELAMECGGYDLALLGKQLEHVRDDESIRAVVIDLQSPGGTTRGVETAAEQIRAVAEAGKRVFAYTSSVCASAAYWLACACDEIHAEGSATVGSISTILAGVDDSRAWELDGLELKLFATGSLKATGHPGKRWTEEEEEFLWGLVRAADADFKGFVRSRRGLDDGVMNGAFWQAKHAPQGLVDSTRFRTLEELVEAVYATL